MSPEKKELYEFLFFGVATKFLPTTSYAGVDWEIGIVAEVEDMKGDGSKEWYAGINAFKILKKHNAIRKVKIHGIDGNRYAWELRYFPIKEK